MLFVTVGEEGVIRTSEDDDGDTWTGGGSCGLSPHTLAVTYGNGIFVIVGAGGKVCTSSNGLQWTSRTSGITQNVEGVTYVSGQYVAVSMDGKIITSTDGIT